MGTSYNPSNLRYPQLLGWETGSLPIRFWIGRRGKWFRWTISTTKFDQNYQPYLRDADTWEAPELPSGLRRLLREIEANKPRTTSLELAEEGVVIDSQSTESITLSGNSVPDAAIESAKTAVDPGKAPSITLDQALQELEGLRTGEKNWYEVASRINHLLAAARTPEHKGTIHLLAVEIYRDRDVLGHQPEVSFHATQALKFERDPVQRSAMFIALGDAAIVRSKDPLAWANEREEAIRWYLRGYAELLPFQLPDAAPELPVVEEIGGQLPRNTQEETNAEQIAVEVRRDIQMKTRQGAEMTGKLIQRRDASINGIRRIYSRNQQEEAKESAAKEQFQRIANQVLRDPKEVKRLMDLIWLEKPVEPEKNHS